MTKLHGRHVDTCHMSTLCQLFGPTIFHAKPKTPNFKHNFTQASRRAAASCQRPLGFNDVRQALWLTSCLCNGKSLFQLPLLY